MSSNIDIKQTNESWTAGSSYKEDNLLDLSKLGAIGSERKISNIFNKSEEDVKFSNREELQSVIPDSDLDEVLKDEEPISGLAQCWDFTLIKDGMYIHSKVSEETNENISVIILLQNFINFFLFNLKLIL